MRIGEIDVRPIIDGVALVPTTEDWIGMPAAAWDAHPEILTTDGRIELAMGGFLVRSGDRTVLIDLGCGTREGMFTGGRFLESLGAEGVTPADITDVVLTHLHFDHIGWATKAGEVVFPNATYRCAAQDWAWFSANDEKAVRKLGGLVEGGRFTFWDTSGPLLPGVDVMLVRSSCRRAPNERCCWATSSTARWSWSTKSGPGWPTSTPRWPGRPASHSLKSWKAPTPSSHPRTSLAFTSGDSSEDSRGARGCH
jgi:Metallo-beta-lactamase superfamily